jgi:thiol:disulfide interchange protein DsbD
VGGGASAGPGAADAGTVVAAPAAAAGFALTLALALLGGALLNLMPCVFPVLSLKVLGFAAHAQRAPRAIAAGPGLHGRRGG